MKKEFITGSKKSVVLTDDPLEAAALLALRPVIGICSPDQVNAWSGIRFIAESFGAVDDEYAALAWDRFFGIPQIVAEAGNWKIREACAGDVEGFMQLYRDRECERFLKQPMKDAETKDKTAWSDWLSYFVKYEYAFDGPACWVIADANDEMLGLIGLELKDARGELPGGWYLGYALLPCARQKKLAAEAARKLIRIAQERWKIEELYLECESDNIASAVTAVRSGFELVQLFGRGGCALSDTKHVVEHTLNDLLSIGTGKLLLFLRK